MEAEFRLDRQTDSSRIVKLIFCFLIAVFFVEINRSMRHRARSILSDIESLESLVEHEFNSNKRRAPSFFLDGSQLSLVCDCPGLVFPCTIAPRSVGRQGEHSGEENNKESRRTISAVSCYRILLFANRWMSGWIDRPRLRPRRHGPRSPINPAGFLLTGVKS